MTAIEVAIERKQWQLVSWYLLVGVSEAAAKLPRESLVALIDVLSGEPAGPAPAKEDGRGR